MRHGVKGNPVRPVPIFPGSRHCKRSNARLSCRYSSSGNSIEAPRACVRYNAGRGCLAFLRNSRVSEARGVSTLLRRKSRRVLSNPRYIARTTVVYKQGECIRQYVTLPVPSPLTTVDLKCTLKKLTASPTATQDDTRYSPGQGAWRDCNSTAMLSAYTLTFLDT